MLVIFFLKLTNNPNIICVCVCGGGGGGGVNVMYKCFKWHFYSSRNTNVPDYSEIYTNLTLHYKDCVNNILKYMLKYKRNGPDKLDL